jgi:predicted dehydrogenase
MKIGIIGAGLIGQERILALKEIQKKVSNLNIVGFYDKSNKVRIEISKKHILKAYPSIEKLLQEGLDWIFISVPHFQIKDIALKALNASVNILVEKPLGISLEETKLIVSKAKKLGLRVNVGMNYRFFKGVAHLIKDIKNKKFGKLISVKLVLGHGNSPEMKNSWKLSKEKCGGGCLIDPGIHILDLINCISTGDIKINSLSEWRGFWNTGIEEEVHFVAKDKNGTIFTSDISLNRWRSEFSVSINGTKKYGHLFGRGKSYGLQKYVVGNRWGWLRKISQKDSEKIIIDDYDCKDSFFYETASVLNYKSIMQKNEFKNYPKPANEEDAIKSMQLMANCQKFLK